MLGDPLRIQRTPSSDAGRFPGRDGRNAVRAVLPRPSEAAIGELLAAGAANQRLRLSRSATKRDRARWVYLPDWLMREIEATCPLEDRVPDRRVFQGVTEGGAYQAMLRACRNAKIPHYHPHDLRHRRISIWHQSGVPARELAEGAGHARPSMSLDVYSHILPPDEIPAERLGALIRP